MKWMVYVRGARAGVRVRSLSRWWALILLCAASTACIDQPIPLRIAQGSEVVVQTPNGPQVRSSLVGSVSTQVEVAVDIAAALAGQPLDGSIQAQEVLIAGESLALGGGVETGTLCIRIDPANNPPGSLTARLNTVNGSGAVDIDVAIQAQIFVTNPALAEQIGGPIALPVPIQTTVDASIGDLLGVLNGTPLPVNITQPLMAALPADTPVLGGSAVTGQLRLETGEADPSALLDECRAFLAAQGA